MDEERTIWQGSSSPVIDLGTYLLCGLAGLVVILLAHAFEKWLAVLLIVPASAAGWKWLDNRCRRYEVTTERIRRTSGVLSRRTDDLELYRVKDTALVQPVLLRLFSLGRVVITTNDASTPVLTIEAVPDAGRLREDIRKCVEARRDLKRVRLAELE
jgi:membrane protein YdbS with pleckstrin-like domain